MKAKHPHTYLFIDVEDSSECFGMFEPPLQFVGLALGKQLHGSN